MYTLYNTIYSIYVLYIYIYYMYYVYDYDIHQVHQGPGSEASDAATLATEAGAFRASLLWFFAFGGGLARNADGGGGCVGAKYLGLFRWKWPIEIDGLPSYKIWVDFL